MIHEAAKEPQSQTVHGMEACLEHIGFSFVSLISYSHAALGTINVNTIEAGLKGNKDAVGGTFKGGGEGNKR